jgi:hypothetical protein
VKRSGRDEPMWVAIYMCMEAMLGISLCLSYYLLCFLFNKIGEQEGRTGSALKGRWEERGGGEVAETIYTHVVNVINNKKE